MSFCQPLAVSITTFPLTMILFLESHVWFDSMPDERLLLLDVTSINLFNFTKMTLVVVSLSCTFKDTERGCKEN